MPPITRMLLPLACSLLLALGLGGCREDERTTEGQTTTVVLPPIPSDTAAGGAMGTAAVDMGESHPGRQAFEALRCTMCHSVSTAGMRAPAETAPDLAGVGDRREDLAAFIQSPEHPMQWRGTPEQAQEIAAWLSGQ